MQGTGSHSLLFCSVTWPLWLISIRHYSNVNIEDFPLYSVEKAYSIQLRNSCVTVLVFLYSSFTLDPPPNSN